MHNTETSYKFRQDVGIYLMFWGLIYIGLSTFCDDEVKRYGRTAAEILFCIAHPILCWIIGVAMSGAYGKNKDKRGLPQGLSDPSKIVYYKTYWKVPVVGKFFIAFLIATGIRMVLIPNCTISIFKHMCIAYQDVARYQKDGTLPRDMERSWEIYQEYKQGLR